jgi:hypothetical protein
MGFPVIETAQDFSSYVTGVHMRKDFKTPHAFGIGAVRFAADGTLIEARFPKINRGENFGSAAAFADVTHHRCGTAVRELGFWELKELEQLLQPFLDATDVHPNTSAFLEVYHLVTKQNMKAVVVFIDTVDEDSYRDNPIYESFTRQMVSPSEALESVH